MEIRSYNLNRIDVCKKAECVIFQARRDALKRPTLEKAHDWLEFLRYHVSGYGPNTIGSEIVGANFRVSRSIGECPNPRLNCSGLIVSEDSSEAVKLLKK